MKKALIILVPLLALAAAGLIAVLSGGKATRTKGVRTDWEGHVVRFHLPGDAGVPAPGSDPAVRTQLWPGGPIRSPHRPELEEPFVAGPTPTATPVPAAPAPKPIEVRLTITPDTTIHFHATPLPKADEGGLTALTAKVQQAVATGTAAFTIDADTRVLASVVIRAMAAANAGGAVGVEVAATLENEPTALAAAAPVGAGGYTAPVLPVVAGPEPRRFPLKSIGTVVLDAARKQMVWREHGQAPEIVDVATLRARLKALQRRFPVPGHPIYSDCAVHVHAGPKVTWAWFAWVMGECAQLGIWRIEAVVVPASPK